MHIFQKICWVNLSRDCTRITLIIDFHECLENSSPSIVQKVVRISLLCYTSPQMLWTGWIAKLIRSNQVAAFFVISTNENTQIFSTKLKSIKNLVTTRTVFGRWKHYWWLHNNNIQLKNKEDLSLSIGWYSFHDTNIFLLTNHKIMWKI